MPPDFTGQQTIFERRLYPHRSLAHQHFRVLMLVLGMANLALGVPFFVLGAWPVLGFCGLDVLIVWLAFRASYRSARAYEDVLLTPLELTIAKVNAAGSTRTFVFNPFWVRLERVEHAEIGLQKLALVSRGRRIAIAGFLGPDAKAEFAREFARALAQTQRGPRYS